MIEFWNGDGGRKWVNYKDRMDITLSPFGQKAIESARILDGERVLDLGCGCGNTTFEIANRVGADGYVQGMDVSRPILAEAKARILTGKERNISFEFSDAQKHVFNSDEFDVIYSRFGVMFFDDPISAFNNIRQSLVAGGRLAFVCWQPIKMNQWVSLPFDVVSKHIPLPPDDDPEQPGAFSLGNKDRLMRVLSEAGYSDISIEPFHSSFNLGADLYQAIEFITDMGPASYVINEEEHSRELIASIVNDLNKELIPYINGNGVSLDAATWIVTARNN